MKSKKSSSIHNRALRFLSFRARSEKEVRDYLHRKLHPTVEIDLEINLLKELKLVNDIEFARLYIESRSRSKPRSSKLILLELRRRGIVSNYPPPIPDLELAQLALTQKHSLKSFEQAVRFLKSRGFSWDVIEKVVKNWYDNDNVS